MRVLLADEDGDATASLAEALTSADVEVSRCHDHGRPSFPCKGLTPNGSCPLDGPAIDAVVASTSDEEHAARSGTLCALRRFVPLVLVGDATRSPLTPFASAFAGDRSEVIEALEAAVRAPMRLHEQAATTMFRQVLDAHGLFDVLASARVTGSGRNVRVSLRPSDPIPADVAELACVRIAGALRAFDSSSTSLSVGVEGSAQAS